MAKTAHRPVDEAADAYEREKGKGRGAITKEAGIKPGSAEFHELKANSKSDFYEDSKRKKGKSEGKGRGK